MPEYAKRGKHFGSIAKRTKACCMCGNKGKFGVWGRYYCKECFIKYLGKDPDKIADKGGKGHSGMLPLPAEKLKEALGQTYMIPLSFKRPYLLSVPKGNKVFASLYLSHYPNSKGIVGRSINYLVIWKEKIAGIIGVNSPPYSVKAVDEFFGITKENRSDALLTIMNNDVFRLITHEKNLGTKTLKAFRNLIKKDYLKKYGSPLVGMLTFVEPPRKGSVYLADNWKYLGMTKGFGTTRRGKRWWDRKWVKKQPKLIFVIKLK